MAPKQTFLLAYAPLNFDLYGVVAAMRAGEKKRGSCRVFHLGTDLVAPARGPQFMHQNGAILRNYSDWRLLFLGGKLALPRDCNNNPRLRRAAGGWHFRSEEGLTDRVSFMGSGSQQPKTYHLLEMHIV